MAAPPNPLRLLVVTTELSSPPRTGSDVVALNTLQVLAGRHELHLVALVNDEPPRLPPGLFTSTQFVRRSLGRVVRLARGVVTRRPFMVALGESAEMNRAVDARLRQTPFDAVVLFEWSAIQYCPPRIHPRVVANIEDPPTLKLERKQGLAVYRPWERARMVVSERLNRDYERRVLPGLGVVSVLSEDDAEAMRAAGHLNVRWLPYGVTAQPASRVGGFATRRPGTLVITGNMFHLPNVDGVLWFLDEVFPLVLRAAPHARLDLVGADPDWRITEAARAFGERVRVTGRVPDLGVFLKEAVVSVCPVRLRIGVQTKVLEALACGTPVVSTEEGNSGVRGTPGVHLHVASEAEQQAARIVELLRGEGWERLSREGHAFAASQFTWARSAAVLEEHVRAVLPR